MSKRVNVGLRLDVYERLKDQGKFGESFSDLISRMIEAAHKNAGSQEGEEIVKKGDQK